MAKKKKLIKGPWSWMKDDIKLPKKLYPRGNTKKIAERLNRPLTAVRQKAYDIGIKTDVYYYWSKEEVKLLKKLYTNTITQELAKRLGRSVGSIKTKAHQLGLRKTDSYLETIKSRSRKRRKKKS